MEHIVEKKPTIIDRAEAAVMLNTSVEVAGNYLKMISYEYPDSLNYYRGKLYVHSSIPFAIVPESVRLSIKEKKIEELKALTRRIAENHLKHNDTEQLKEAIKKLIEEIDKL
jgi:L-2-hydroxyglutarate oxidase LhgO